MRGRTSRQRKPCEKVSEAWPCSTWSGIRPGAWEAWARGPEPHLFCHPCLVSAETWPPGLWLQCPSPAPHLALSQASAMSSPLRALFLLALGLGLAGTLNPKDPNTCSFWESFTTTTKESHSRPFSLLPSEPCDRPWESPHTCPRPTVVYRTVYRQVVKTEHRMRLQCCQGFYESSGACVPLCARECVHGRCVAPNQCQCVQDWRGDDCSSACALGVWGPQCDKPCNCGNSSSCDPKSGACSCPSGLQPPHCFRPCSPGRYGPACQFSCQCHGAPCDPQTGACLCPPERTGPSCEVSCSQDSVGFFCPSTPPCQNGGVFQASRGSCSCPPGWMGTICSLPCPEGSYGPNCSQECRCHNGGLCDRFTGQCRCAPGYTGDRCREECPVGRFGQDCAETCDCATGARCFPANGACLCEHGFTGDRCAERLCPDGLYGLSCQMPCTCDPEHSLNCHPMSGECSCLPGWAGLHCNESCPQDTHGPGCQEHCLCLHGGVCQPDSGLCRCAPGYTGPHCASLCPPDTYGVNCSARCSCENAIACSPIDGTCVCKEEEATKTQKVVVHPLRSFNLLSNIQQFLCLSPMRPWAAPPPAPAHSAEPGRANAQCVLAQEGSQVPMPTCKSPLPGWQHGNCSVPCPPGTWGFGCNASCQCAHEAACSPQTGACTCTPGWHGTHCQFPCLKGMFGEGCASRCDCDHSDGCDPVHGHCQCQAGWTGTRCHLPCPEGFWGTNCSNTCTCKNGGTCIPENGNCVCAPGFRGPSCQRSCQPGRYGKRCVPCKCANHSSCHPSNGTCYCMAGWTGPDCSQPCPLGHWGANCAQLCHCRHGGTCHPQHGSCFCPPGRTGHLCLEGCSPGVFGANCSQPCQCGPGERCHPETGACVCPPGHSGAPCRIGSQEPFTMMPTSPVAYNSLGAVIGIAVLGSLVVALVALFIGYRHWQKGKAHQHLAVAYSSGRLDGSEYVMPGNSRLDRSYSCSYSNRNGPGPFYSKGPISEEGLGASVASLSSENPYATIRDLPSLLGSPRESSYMEMKGPPSGSPPRQPPQLRDSQRRRHPQPERDSGTYEQPSPLTHDRDSVGSQPPLPPGLPPGHYDSPKNSHIPGHYDLPPVRHPPSPPLRRQDR
ncbi:platelet endothelial aggregation receptor 1 isoform X7 [Tursiops truncatus]|uniref:platelet endothelial aggregation receptor 1 isoform X7 n=1 Tax=Tursiops truncatus TaxID=9739 RepID=UPI003CCF49D0